MHSDKDKSNNIKRRKFIQQSALIGAALPFLPSFTTSILKPKTHHLTILHTNDQHSRIEPFPVKGGGRNAGRGGMARRAALIKEIRQEEDQVLLLDCGDIFQGTPYFNFFGGELEFKLMDEMQYDAATIGNHDFDAGYEVLHQRVQSSKFSMLNSNYNLKNSILNEVVEPYKIIQKGAIKVGIFGVGIKLNGLVPKNLYGEIEYRHPYEIAEQTATFLKKSKQCDLVICLSHIGYQYKSEKLPSDVQMAAQTRNIDIILGGHTHTFLKQATEIKDKDQNTVIVNQAGWAGLVLGRLDVSFEQGKKNKCFSCKNQFLRMPIENSNVKHK